jgi:mono/diheme cytochrome c family protein
MVYQRAGSERLGRSIRSSDCEIAHLAFVVSSTVLPPLPNFLMRMTYSSLARSASLLFAAVAIAACSHGGASTAATPATGNSGANPTNSAARRGLPNGVTALMVAQGDSLFHSRACARCHGADAHGAQNGPNLTTGKFMHTDGSYQGFIRVITSGIPADSIRDKSHQFPMAPRGGARPAPLTDTEIQAVAAYVYSLNHQG